MIAYVRQAPGQHQACCPVEDSAQIDPVHRNVGRVHGSDLIRAVDGQIPRQVRIDALRLVSPIGVGLAENCQNCLVKGFANQKISSPSADIPSVLHQSP